MLSQLNPVHAPTSHFLKTHLISLVAAIAVTDPELHRLLTFQAPSLLSLSHCLAPTKIQCICFVTTPSLRWGLSAACPNFKLEDHTLSDVRDCYSIYIFLLLSSLYSYCCLCILIFRPCILNVVYVFLLLSMYSYCSSMYSYHCLCILIVVYVFSDAATLNEVFPCFFLGCKVNASV